MFLIKGIYISNRICQKRKFLRKRNIWQIELIIHVFIKLINNTVHVFNQPGKNMYSVINQLDKNMNYQYDLPNVCFFLEISSFWQIVFEIYKSPPSPIKDIAYGTKRSSVARKKSLKLLKAQIKYEIFKSNLEKVTWKNNYLTKISNKYVYLWLYIR